MVSQSKAIATTATTGVPAPYVPFGGQRTIGSEAQRPRPEFVTLSWCSGRPAQRPLVENGKAVIDEATGEIVVENCYYAGFFCDVGEDEELDAALQAVGAPKISISHQEGYAEHWNLQRCALYLLAAGVQSKAAMRNTNERLGVAYGWRLNKAGTPESYLYCQVLPRQLLGLYNKPLVLAIRSKQTEYVLQLFARQFLVIKAAHEVLRAQDMDMALPLWCYALPCGPAKKQVTHGTQPGRMSDVFPVVALVPERIGVDYLSRYEAPTEHLSVLHALAEQSVAWSSDLVARIADEAESGGGGVSAAGCTG